MLRSDHAIQRYDFNRLLILPDRLRRGRDDAYIAAANTLLRIYRDGKEKTRQSLHQAAEGVLSRVSGCPPRRVASFCKLLDDLGEFQKAKKTAAALRQKVFALGASLHPIVEQREGIFEHDLMTARHKLSESLGMSWEKIESILYSDVVELQKLLSFASEITPVELLSSYNVAQTQVALYRATQVRIDASEDYKTILRHAKLAGLMHQIERLEKPFSGYRFLFDGPQSSLRETTRYGVRFARILPKLLTCRSWQLTARVLGPGGRGFRLALAPADGLKSPLSMAEEFDSQLEAEIEKTWLASPVEGWSLGHETEFLHAGQTVLTPDFVLKHRDTQQTIYVEVVGFWTPEYLAEKVQRLSMFINSPRANADLRWLLIIPKPGAKQKVPLLEQIGVPVLVYEPKQSAKIWIETALGERPIPKRG